MQRNICCGCHKYIQSTNFKNIFTDDIEITEHESNLNLCETRIKKMKIYHGIELFIGHKITNIEKISYICTKCFLKIKFFLSFRLELSKSFNEFYCLKNDILDNEPISLIDNTNEVLCSKTISISDNKILELQDNININTYEKIGSLMYQTESKSNDTNVDENSLAIAFNDRLENECNTANNSDSNKSRNNSESNDINDSGISDSKRFIKQNEIDLESEIDVCSGEDDEVLELDVQNKNSIIVEIESSSESEIEVCDYEPYGKKFKNCRTLSNC